jgi:hypothetical protein
VKRPLPAKSGLVLMMQPNDWTEVILPDAEPDDRSRPGPFLTVGGLVSNDRNRGTCSR